MMQDPMSNATTNLRFWQRYSPIPGYDALYATTFYIVIPMWFIGSVINGWFVAVLVAHQRSMLRRNRMAKIMLFVICCCLLWSLGGIAEGILMFLDLQPDDINPIAGIAVNLLITLMFTGNMMLAMERFFITRKLPAKSTQIYYWILIALVCMAAALFVWLFTGAMSPDGIVPGNDLKSLYWAYATAAGFTLSNAVTITLYIRAYLHSSSLLQKNFDAISKLIEKRRATATSSLCRTQPLSTNLPTDSEILQLETLRFTAERQSLINCIIMSTVLMICYLPQLSYNISVQFLIDANQSFGNVDVVAWNCLGHVCICSDVIIQPALILYFRRDFRSVFFLGSGIRISDAAYQDHEDTDSEIS